MHRRGMIRRGATHPFGAALKGVLRRFAPCEPGLKLNHTNLRQIKNPHAYA